MIGEFGSERLVQRVVDTILRHTAPKIKDKEGASTSVVSPYQDTEWSAEESSKIILTGHKVLLKHLPLDHTDRAQGIASPPLTGHMVLLVHH